MQRSLWSANVGIAFGLKGILWFLSTEYVDRETLAVKPKAEEIRRINRMFPVVCGGVWPSRGRVER